MDSHCLVLLFLCFPGVLLDSDPLYGLALGLVHDVCINLRGTDVGVGQKMGNGIDVRSFTDLEGCEGMPEAMERDMLRDSGCLQPVLERPLRIVPLEVLEYFSAGSGSAELIRFLGQRQSSFRVCLLGLDTDAPAPVLRFFNITPGKSKYITDTQSSKTTEERRFLQVRSVAWSGSKLADFVDGQVLAAADLRLDGIKIIIDILPEILFPEGYLSSRHGKSTNSPQLNSGRGSLFRPEAAWR